MNIFGFITAGAQQAHPGTAVTVDDTKRTSVSLCKLCSEYTNDNNLACSLNIRLRSVIADFFDAFSFERFQSAGIKMTNEHSPVPLNHRVPTGTLTSDPLGLYTHLSGRFPLLVLLS